MEVVGVDRVAVWCLSILTVLFGFNQDHDIVEVVILVDGLLFVVDWRRLSQLAKRDSQFLLVHIVAVLALFLITALVLLMRWLMRCILLPSPPFQFALDAEPSLVRGAATSLDSCQLLEVTHLSAITDQYCTRSLDILGVLLPLTSCRVVMLVSGLVVRRSQYTNRRPRQFPSVLRCRNVG